MIVTMPPINLNSLDFPLGFCDLTLEAVKDRMLTKLQHPCKASENFLGAVNGIRYRLVACADYDKDFRESLQRFGDAPPLQERARQEQYLFGFFTSGLATLESFHYGMYFADAAIHGGAPFYTDKPGHLQGINRKSTTEAFNSVFPSESLTKALTALGHDPICLEWDAIRNVLAHRAAPGRNISLALCENATPVLGGATWLAPGSPRIDAALTATKLKWLVGTMGNLLQTAAEFGAPIFHEKTSGSDVEWAA